MGNATNIRWGYFDIVQQATGTGYDIINVPAKTNASTLYIPCATDIYLSEYLHDDLVDFFKQERDWCNSNGLGLKHQSIPWFIENENTLAFNYVSAVSAGANAFLDEGVINFSVTQETAVHDAVIDYSAKQHITLGDKHCSSFFLFLSVAKNNLSKYTLFITKSTNDNDVFFEYKSLLSDDPKFNAVNSYDARRIIGTANYGNIFTTTSSHRVSKNIGNIFSIEELQNNNNIGNYLIGVPAVNKAFKEELPLMLYCKCNNDGEIIATLDYISPRSRSLVYESTGIFPGLTRKYIGVFPESHTYIKNFVTYSNTIYINPYNQYNTPVFLVNDNNDTNVISFMANVYCSDIKTSILNANEQNIFKILTYILTTPEYTTAVYTHVYNKLLGISFLNVNEYHDVMIDAGLYGMTKKINDITMNMSTTNPIALNANETVEVLLFRKNIHGIKLYKLGTDEYVTILKSGTAFYGYINKNNINISYGDIFEIRDQIDEYMCTLGPKTSDINGECVGTTIPNYRHRYKACYFAYMIPNVQTINFVGNNFKNAEANILLNVESSISAGDTNTCYYSISQAATAIILVKMVDTRAIKSIGYKTILNVPLLTNYYSALVYNNRGHGYNFKTDASMRCVTASMLENTYLSTTAYQSTVNLDCDSHNLIVLQHFVDPNIIYSQYQIPPSQEQKYVYSNGISSIPGINNSTNALSLPYKIPDHQIILNNATDLDGMDTFSIACIRPGESQIFSNNFTQAYHKVYITLG